ncbi:MAG: ABC transporter substrate-binding protein [Parvibaculaceae bacterium]|nr:ABC transporter substrate-binding protein [Parvibaculaceae bacterium]
MNSRSARARSVLSVLAMAFSALLIALTLNATPARAGDDPAAEQFVTKLSLDAIKIISDKTNSKAQKEQGFYTLFTQNADVPKIAAFCLGQYVRLPDDQQKQQYLKLFTDFVVKIYVTRLSGYTDQTITVTGSQLKGKNVLVMSQINFTDGRPPVKVTWWLLKKPDGYKIFDVNVVGVWLAQEQRASFASVISNNRGQFQPLLDTLNKQIADAEQGKLPPTEAAVPAN